MQRIMRCTMATPHTIPKITEGRLNFHMIRSFRDSVLLLSILQNSLDQNMYQLTVLSVIQQGMSPGSIHPPRCQITLKEYNQSNVLLSLDKEIWHSFALYLRHLQGSVYCERKSSNYEYRFPVNGFYRQLEILQTVSWRGFNIMFPFIPSLFSHCLVDSIS